MDKDKRYNSVQKVEKEIKIVLLKPLIQIYD